MRTYLFESVAEPMLPHNWGAYMVAVPDAEELSWHSHVAPSIDTLFERLGHPAGHAWVMDLLTGEGAWFTMAGDARAELEEHRIHVTASFEGFLEWLYLQDLTQLWRLPHTVKVADTTFSIKERRHLGPFPVAFTLRKGDVIAIEWGGKVQLATCDGLTEEGASIRSLTMAELAELGFSDDEAEVIGGDPEDGDDGEDGQKPALSVLTLPAEITADDLITPPALAEGTLITSDLTAALPDAKETTEIPAVTADTTETASIEAVTDDAPGTGKAKK